MHLVVGSITGCNLLTDVTKINIPLLPLVYIYMDVRKKCFQQNTKNTVTELCVIEFVS